MWRHAQPSEAVISADAGHSNGRALLAKWRSWREASKSTLGVYIRGGVVANQSACEDAKRLDTQVHSPPLRRRVMPCAAEIADIKAETDIKQG